MSVKKFLLLAVASAVLLLLQVTVAKKVNENAEDLAEISDLTFTTTGDRYKAYGSKGIPQGMSSRSGNVLNIPSGQECNNYRNLSSPDRAQRAVNIKERLCDNSGYGNFTAGWYRFTGDAGNKLASSCVPIFRCSTVIQGWLNGSHPTGNFSLARRRVCFHWSADCCFYEVNIWIRNCGDFYIYELPVAPACPGRYCGNGKGPLNNPSKCGGSLTSLAGEINSPGYPNYMEPISCNWTIKAPFDGKMLLYFEDMKLSFEGCPSNNLTIVAENERHTFCRKRDPFYLLITKRTPIQINIHYESVYWNKMSGFKLRFAMIKENLDKAPTISHWNISAKVKSTSTIQVSWTHINGLAVLSPDQHIYGYVVLYKPLDYLLKNSYILTKSDAATITISGLTGGTEYALQVVALVKRNNISTSVYGSATLNITTFKGECYYYDNLTSPTRAQGAPVGNSCDRELMATPKWYRFWGEAGKQIATSCVPKRRCGTASPGWMNGAHPSVQDGIVMRTVCFHWFEDCCKWKVNIKVRNCGSFHVYRLHSTPACYMRYCGSKGACGNSFNDTTGTLTSPGYPTRIYWNSKCQWNFTAPSPSGVIVVIVEHLSIPISARCLKFALSFENADGKQVGKVCGVQRFFTWVSQGSAILRFFSERTASRWVGFKARYFIFKNDLTNIPDISQWTGVSAQANNSTSITVQWGPYPASPGSPSVTEYLIICVPDGLPLNATVFTTDVSQNSLVVTGLMKYTNYTVQIVVDRNENISSFDDYRRSQSTRVRTKEDVPSEGPQNLTAMATDTSITVTWQPIPEHARHGEITSYVIYYKRAWTSDSYSTKTAGSSDNKAILRELELVTEYRIEMAGNTSGVGTKTKPVFATTGCRNVTHASKTLLTWIFTSPRHPDNYPSKLNCKWVIDGSKIRLGHIYVVFETFHLEEEKKCSADNVSFKSPNMNGQSTLLCGKKDPFAIKLMKLSKPPSTSQVILKADKGIEQSGFKARVFVVLQKNTINLNDYNYSQPNKANEVVFSWSKPLKNKEILEYVVIYSRNDTDPVWNATITNGTKAVLAGIQPGRGYRIFILFYTSGNIAYMSNTIPIEASGSTVTVIPQWTGVSAQANNSTSITVQWGPYPASPGSPSVTKYLIICVPDSLPLNATLFTATTNVTVSQNSLVVTGLMKYTNYTIQIVVDRNVNISSFDDYRRSQSTRVRTKEDVPSEGPQNLTAIATDTNITVTWQPIPEHARHGEITSYIIYYKRAWTSDSYSTKIAGSSDKKAILRELELVTEYRIEMAAYTSVGLGTKTKPVFNTTATGDMVNPAENTEDVTGARDVYTSTYAMAEGQASSERKAVPRSRSRRSGQVSNNLLHQECSNYTILSSPDRAQGAIMPNGRLCDSTLTTGWYRFSGDAGDKMASSCVPRIRCGTHAPGWMNGNHPTTSGSIVKSEVCFNWNEDCCRWKIEIRVRNCGHFYVYELPRFPSCSKRYCGNALGPLNKTLECGGNLTSLAGEITSPGYPNYMEPITCNWTIKAPFDGNRNILFCFENLILSHKGCSSNLTIGTRGRPEETICTTQKNYLCRFGNEIVSIRYQSSDWKMKLGFTLRYVMVNGNLNNAVVQSKWDIRVKVNGSSAIQVSWQVFSGFLNATEYVYGYVVVCKPVNQQSVYLLTGPDAATITITGLTGGTKHTLQVVALVSEYGKQNVKSMVMNGSRVINTYTKKGECEYYQNLTSWNRGQGAPGSSLGDRNISVTWHRFSGQAGTQMATSCVPKRKCGTEAPGWMMGTHPAVKDGIVTRTVCFHWSDDCCLWRSTIGVRNCGEFYVYFLHKPPAHELRYCGNKGGCGKAINDTSGTLTSPGYPTRIYWNSKCQWNFTAPSPSGVIVVIVEHLSIPISARCLKFYLSFENKNEKQVGKVCGVQRFFTWVSQGSAILRFSSGRAASRWVGFKARYFIFKNDLTNISDILQWTGVSAQPINSTSITVKWGSYPEPSVSSPVTEYLIICVPDGLPLNATVFTTNTNVTVSKYSLVVTGLMKYTNYTIQIVIDRNENISSFDDYRRSQSTRARTNEDVPSEGPQNLTAMATDTTITVSWKLIPEHARNGEITSYVIYYKKTWTSDNYSTIIVGSQHDNTNLTKLEQFTEYRIEMAGKTSVGVGTKSRAVFVVTGCKDSELASKRPFSWTFTSPHYPNQYPSNVDCTWSIGSTIGRNRKMYIVFDEFHLEEKINNCSDYVSVTSNGKSTQRFYGKQDPFALKLTRQSKSIKLKSDGGLEENGFHARVFVVTTPEISVTFRHNATNGVIYNSTLQWLKPNITKELEDKEDILEYVVLYSEDDNNMVWKASITNTTKAILTRLEPQRIEKYFAVLLFRTSKGKAFFGTTKFILPRLTTTSPTKPTDAPKMNGSTIYPFGDKMVPNTQYFSTRCFRIDIPGDGMQFYNKRHHMVHICRNGLLLFETEQLIRWSRRFSERDSVYRKTAIIAPFWALTDVEDAFVVHNISKVFYQVYDSSDATAKKILNQATFDVKTFHLDKKGLYEEEDHKKPTENFEAKWVLVVTWVNLRPPNAHNLPSRLNNTFQVVLITDGVCSFVMYNYPHNGIQWSAPTLEKYYERFIYYRGLPVVGLNGGEKKREYYHVKGSGETGIVNINSISGKTVRTLDNDVKKDYYEIDLQPGKWFFRVETALPRKPSGSDICKKWFKSHPDHRGFTEHLEPCPCTYRQASWDERFKMESYGWPFICANSIFPSIDGWEQKCCYSKLNGALVKGHPGGGYPISSNYKTSDMKSDSYASKECCVLSNQCKLFYKKRPSDDCKRYKETEWSWFMGDPHFVTLDGLNYTFNGLGEYIMADISNGLFQLQARTKLVDGGGKATVFVSAVAKETGSSAVQVNLKPGQDLEVLVNGTLIDHTTLTNTTTLYNGSVALSRPDHTSITVLFPCGISVKMTNVKDSLAILLAAPEKFKNKTRGLLGVWNGDPKDDLTTPTGRVLPTDSTGRTIHYEFGQKWQVTDIDSLFTYKKGQSVSTFSNPSFEPMFIEDYNFTDDAVKQEALEKCEGDLNCLFDVALTNDVTMGTSTKKVGSRLKKESEALKNSVPKFLNDSSTFYVTINTTARIEIFAKDDDGDQLTFNVSGILPETLDINTDSGCSVVISWKVTMDKIKLEVTVMDDKGAVALLRPEVHVCACHNGGYCAPDSSNNVFADSTNDTFLIMPCTCIHGYTGRFCENDLNACQANLNPCYPGIICTDLPPPAGVFGYQCGPCPRGFTGDGAACLDLDECDGGKDGCSQICVNTPGSFVCDCNHGYRLDIDQKTCNDIDECFPASDCMQKCTNTDGSYTCGCDAGFKVNPNDPKKCVPKIPCTDGKHGCQHICYTKDGRQKCACHQGYKLMNDQKSCEDIDECSTRKSRCNQYCHNTDGSYSCSCKKGFRMNNDGVTCVDVDECMELTYQCPNPSQICLNTAGSYKCVCGPGLYLTVNNTCREILPGHTTPSPGPAPTPKPPTDNEKDNAVRITVEKLHISEWNERLEKKFKRSVAKAVTSFCASKDEECKEARKRERRALDYILYTADQVHLLPDFPKQINLKSRDLAGVIAFYVEFPPEVVSTSGDSIKGGILVEIVGSAKADIEKALNRTIGSITLNKRPSTEKKPAKLNISVIIGVTLGGVLFIVIVGVLISRARNRNSTFRIKRNQEKKERRARARNVNNACYDDGIPGEFRLGPTQSTTDILEETGNENVKTTELGIDNFEVDLK